MAEKPSSEIENDLSHAENPHRTLAAAPTEKSDGAPVADSARSKETPSAQKALSSAEAAAKHPVGFIRQTELIDLVKAYDPSADEKILNKAYVFAMKAHGDQTRQSGDPYFSHPLAVAAILTELNADPASVVTALLHDVVEDTDYTLSLIHI